MYTISFNNKNSYYDLGLKIPHRPNIPVAEKNIKTYEVEGRDGSLIEEFGYKDIEIPVSFNVIDRININNKCRQIKVWLNGDIDNNKLIFSDDDGYFYKVKYVKMNKDIERVLRVLGRFTAVFVCEPFCYLEEGLDKITINKATSLYNQGTYKSEPILTLYGSGNITLTINNKNLYLTNVQDYITIDSVLKDCYKDTQLCNSKMLGDFPILIQGENIISWQGNVTKVEIQPNWRTL